MHLKDGISNCSYVENICPNKKVNPGSTTSLSNVSFHCLFNCQSFVIRMNMKNICLVVFQHMFIYSNCAFLWCFLVILLSMVRKGCVCTGLIVSQNRSGRSKCAELEKIWDVNPESIVLQSLKSIKLFQDVERKVEKVLDLHLFFYSSHLLKS